MPSSLAVARIDHVLPESVSTDPTYQPNLMPDLYALICEGDCMSPIYKDGAVLHFSRLAPWAAGDCVALFRKPETVQPGESPVLFKQLVIAPPASYWREGEHAVRHAASTVRHIVIYRTLNPDRYVQLYADELLGIHKCVGVAGR